PGFDVDTRTRFASSTGPYALLASVSSALLTLAFILAPVDSRTRIMTAIAVVAAVVLLAVVSGLWPTRRRYQLRQVRTGLFKPPDRRLLPPKRPKAAHTGQDGGRNDGNAGEYPLDRDVFLMGPSVIIGLVAPQAGAASGAASTTRRDAPGALLDPSIGPNIGVAGEADSSVHLPASSLSDGVAMIGRRGSGKSLALRLIYAWMALDRVSPSRIPGAPGQRTAMIAFESKGEGAAAYQNWCKAVGDRTVLVDLADPTTPALDIFSVPGTLTQRLSFILDALVYAFEPGEIQGRSAESLSAAFAGALVVGSPSMRIVGLPEGCPAGRSPVYYAHVLLGGYGDERAVALAGAIAEGAALAERNGVTDAEDLTAAEGQLSVLFGSGSTKVTPSQRRTQTEAARNKLRYLAAAESWWDPKRTTITWKQVLAGHRSVIINTGVSTKGELVDDKTIGYMSSLLMYSLRDSIMRYCNGWAAEHRFVTIFSDELSLLAGSTPEVIAWCQDKGRSYGVIPIFATQRLDQLTPQVQKVMRDLGTAYWFAQRDPEVATIASRDLSADQTDWTAEDIKNLPPYTAVIRTQVDGSLQPPVPVRLLNAEADMAGFARIQRTGAGAPHDDDASDDDRWAKR
ncbi:MAG: type IV secretory system conjugative DNA transfer family protein, partial [Actinomycetota bacterium]|nr:type IV secretory system conjugative DNA transfer family protein [Actinomycetota bacterium]